MMKNEDRRIVAGAFAATALLAGLIFGTPVANADPGDTTLGTGSPAAAPSSGDGKGSPSYDTPVSIPSQATQHQGDGGSVPSKPWCPNNAASCPGNR